MPPPQGMVVRVKFKDRRQFENCWVKDISNGGIFLRTQSPAEVFSRLTVVLELPNGDSVDLVGEVVRVVATKDAHGGVAPGMGVQFVDLSPEKRSLLENYLGQTPNFNLPDGLVTLSDLLVPPAAAPNPDSVQSQAWDIATSVGRPPPKPIVSAARPAPAAASGAGALDEVVAGLLRLLWLCGDPALLAKADYYEVLGLDKTCSAQRIAEVCAFLKTLVDASLPPAGLSPGATAAAHARVALLRRFIDDIDHTLGDLGRRTRYDSTRGPR